MIRQTYGYRAPLEQATRRYCECGRELTALMREFGPQLAGHIVKCESCGGKAHRSEDHTVCLRCGNYTQGH